MGTRYARSRGRGEPKLQLRILPSSILLKDICMYCGNTNVFMSVCSATPCYHMFLILSSPPLVSPTLVHALPIKTLKTELGHNGTTYSKLFTLSTYRYSKYIINGEGI